MAYRRSALSFCLYTGTLLLICIIVLQLPMNTNAKPLRILGLFPHPGKTHFYFFHPILRELAEVGHDVVVISPFPDKNPPKGYHDLQLPGNIVQNTVDIKMLLDNQFYTHFMEFFLLHSWGETACNTTLNSAALRHVLQQRGHFDVILLEQFNTDCLLGVAHQLKAPVIGLSSCFMMPWHFERTGSPIIPSYIPALFLGQTDQMTLDGRIANWISFHGLNLLYKFYSIPSADRMLKQKFGNDIPSVKDLAKETSVLFVNQHFSFHGAYPLGPRVIELGGLHIGSAQPLDLELQKFMDGAEHGVILISWGSIVRAETLPLPMLDGMLKAIRRLKQRVIWKWENDTIPDKPDNLYISKWLPQRDILCHPKVKAFMSHAGLMGSSEAVYCGVPVIATPMYGDQFLNAAAFVRRGMGVILHLKDINENNVIKSVKKILDESFMASAKKVSSSYRNRPVSALKEAVWWVEYVAGTNGAPLLKSHATEMSWFTYYSIDIYLILTIAISVLFTTLYFVLRRLLFPPKQTSAIKQKLK